MKRVIWKYELPEKYAEIETRGVPDVLAVGLDPQGRPCIWMAVDPDGAEGRLRIEIAWTGEEMPKGTFLGTVTTRALVLHVFVV